MSKYTNQKQAHDFLLNKFDTLETFTKEEFEDACGWPKEKDTFSTYWTKQFRRLLVQAGEDTYRVSEVFRRFVEWDAFQSHVTQNKHVTSDYNGVTYSWVMMFEFFMPLTNESYLRTTLDALFYKDRVKRRLRANLKQLKKHFPSEGLNDGDGYLDQVCKWVTQHFGGYSIGHVAGRYRAGELKTLQEVHQLKNNRYLVDETTAIVRFIIPFGKRTATAFESDTVGGPASDSPTNGEAEATKIRYVFGILFIQQIVEAVNGEDEIWLLESGFRSKLHVWSKS